MRIQSLLKQYAFSLVVILCSGLFLCGITAAREKTRYNMDLTSYAVVKNESGKLTVNKGEDVIVIAENGKIVYINDFYEKIMKILDEK